MTVPQLRAHTLLGVPSQRSDGHHKMVDFGLRKERRSPWSPAGCGVSVGDPDGRARIRNIMPMVRSYSRASQSF